MAFYQGTNVGYGQPQAASAQGAPINTASAAVRPQSSLQQYQPPPSYLGTDPGFSSYEALAQSPEWVQNYTEQRVRKPQSAGAYDPSLQMRDIYGGLQPGLQRAYSQYGAEAVENPYFINQGNEFASQYNSESFNPFGSQLNDYTVGQYGNIMSAQRNPFTGELIGAPSQMAARREDAYNWDVEGRATGIDRGFRSEYERLYQPYLGMSFQEWLDSTAKAGRAPINPRRLIQY